MGRFKFGDIIENGWAADTNPTKRGIYLWSFNRTGRMNPGMHVKLLRDDGTTGELRISDDDKMTVVGTIFDAKVSEAIAAKVSEDEWKPIATCPIREPVDLWCVYGGEEFAQFDGGASIGKLVSSRIKTEEYGFFGNQSNDGVPQRDAPDLVPVAWRKVVPNCPAQIIAAALGIPLTLEAALKEQADA